MPRVRQFLRSPRLIMLLVTLGTLLALHVASVVWRQDRSALGTPDDACPSVELERLRYPSPRFEITPPPGPRDQSEMEAPSWVGWAKPMALDFTRAMLLGQEELARSFVAPDYPLDIPALQRHLGITCVPNTFSITTRWALIETDQAIVEPTLYLGDATLTFQIVFRPYPEGWRITAVDPVPADRSRRVAE